MDPISIRTERLLLRTMTVADVGSTYVGWLNDPEVKSWLHPTHNHYTLENCREYVAGYTGRTDKALIGVFSDAVTHVGNLTMSAIDWRREVATIGISLGRQYRGKGYGHEALEALCGWCLDCLPMCRLVAQVAEHNLRSLRLFLGCGFVIEGYMRSCDVADGVRTNGYLMARLREE